MSDNPTRDILNNHVIYEGGGVSELVENTYYEEYPIPLTEFVPTAFIANKFPVHMDTPSNIYGLEASKWKYLEIGLANYLGSAIYNAMTFPTSTTVTTSYADSALFWNTWAAPHLKTISSINNSQIVALFTANGIADLLDIAIWYGDIEGYNYSYVCKKFKTRQYHRTETDRNNGAYFLTNPFASYITAGEVRFNYIWGGTDIRKVSLTPAYYRSFTGHNHYSSRTYDSAIMPWLFSGSDTWVKVSWKITPVYPWSAEDYIVENFECLKPFNEPTIEPTCPDFNYYNKTHGVWIEDEDVIEFYQGDPLLIKIEYIDKSDLTDNKIYGFLPSLFQRLYNTYSEI